MSKKDSSFIPVRLGRKKSVDSCGGDQKQQQQQQQQRHDNGTSSSSSTTTGMNERTPLVANAQPQPQSPTTHRSHHMDVINTCNLSDAVRRQIDERLEKARLADEATCVLFAFAVVYGGGGGSNDECKTINNCEAFENDIENVMQLAPQGQVTTLDQLCVETQRFTKIYKQVIALWRYIRQAEPQVHLILQKRCFKQRNAGAHVNWLDRLRTPLLNGGYYTIIADFAQGSL